MYFSNMSNKYRDINFFDMIEHVAWCSKAGNIVLGVNKLYVSLKNIYKRKNKKKYNVDVKSNYISIYWFYNLKIWRPSRKSKLTPKATKARVVRYAIIQSPQCFSGLTHSSSEASIYNYSKTNTINNKWTKILSSLNY